jgi:hypothetical protein
MGSRTVVLRLGDITRLLDGERISLSRRQCEQQGGEFPYYGPQGLIARIGSFSYEGDHLLLADTPPRNPPAAPAFVAHGRFSANTHVHVLACVEEVEPRFLCRYLNALPPATLFRSPWPEHVNDIEIALLPPADQRQVLSVIDDIERKTALLRDQNQVLNEMAQSLFDHCFIFGGGKPRPLGDFVVFRATGSDGPPGPGTAEGTVFHKLLICPREGLPPLFAQLLVRNPEFLAYAGGCRGAKRRPDADWLAAFELSGPLNGQGDGAYPPFNAFALNVEKKLAANNTELKLLADLEQSLFSFEQPAPFHT